MAFCNEAQRRIFGFQTEVKNLQTLFGLGFDRVGVEESFLFPKLVQTDLGAQKSFCKMWTRTLSWGKAGEA